MNERITPGPSLRFLPVLALLALGFLGTALYAAQKVRLEGRVAKVVGENKLAVEVGDGEYRGRWGLRFRTLAPKPKKNDSVRITADRETLERRNGPVVVGFKGSDEELQAIIDWLGSLE